MSIQATSIKVESLPFSIILAAVYCPPGRSVLSQDFTNLFNLFGTNFIVGGDWNAKHTFWGSRLISPKGRALYSATRAGSFKFLTTGEPTHWPTDPAKRPDVIDFFVTCGLANNYTHIERRDELSSDHSPLVLTLSSTVIIKPKPPRLTTHKTNWDAFKYYIEENVNLNLSLKTPDDVDNAAQYLTTIIQKAASFATATPEKGTEEQINLPKQIRDLIVEKRRVRRRWQNYRNANDKRILNKLTRKLTTLLQKRHNDALENFLTSLSINDNSLWRATKGLKRPHKHVPPLKKPSGQYGRSDEEKANMFGNHLSSAFQPFPPAQDADMEEQSKIQEFLDVPCQMTLPIKAISASEIKFALRNIKKNKAPGYDLITGKLLQELPDKGIALITQVFNAMLRLTYWPIIWKTIHEDLKIPFVTDVIKSRPQKYQKRIPNHANHLIRDLNKPVTNNRRLKRTWPIDLFE
ncbi:hypothetical protein M8J75_011494 [Diaphorina citri]|nr:hypothetical protein M8J75_011494 [Diaphorina citri]